MRLQMNNHSRISMLGVTLLEVMLVLAIAAMIIVMSIRYYQGASVNQQANQYLSQIQAITAAVENLTVGNGKYIDITDVQIKSIAGSNALTSPWGGTIGFVGRVNGFEVTPTSSPNSATCTLIEKQLESSSKYKVTCPAATVSYDTTR